MPAFSCNNIQLPHSTFVINYVWKYGESVEKGLRNFVLKLDLSSPMCESGTIIFNSDCGEVAVGIKSTLIFLILFSNS